ncbi:hypothetical protein QTP88_029563 [Uroleucon formosanum]
MEKSAEDRSPQSSDQQLILNDDPSSENIKSTENETVIFDYPSPLTELTSELTESTQKDVLVNTTFGVEDKTIENEKIIFDCPLLNFLNLLQKKNDPFLYIKKNLSTEEKSFIVLLGPCQPLADDLPDGIFPKDKTYRIDNFNELWYQRIMPDGSKLSKDWLSYSPQLNKIFYLC